MENSQHLYDKVRAGLWQLDEDHLQEVCRYLKCDVSSGKPRRWLIKTIKSMLDEMLENEGESEVIQSLKDLLSFMNEVKQDSTDVEVMLEKGNSSRRAERKVSVARGVWFSEVCSGRETQQTAVSKWVKCKMRKNLCLIAVIGVERPDKNHRRTGRRQRERRNEDSGAWSGIRG